jgi:threonine dehydratase
MIADPSKRPTGWGDAPLVAPTRAEVAAAAERIGGVAVRTPLIPLAGHPGLLLKPELLQPTGSFKLRGVYNWAVSLSPTERAAGFSTFSAGNTALALGWCARRFGVRCRSLLPDTASEYKVRALQAAGVETILVPFSAMADWLFAAGWRNEPYAFLHPWTEPLLVAGHATIGREILEDLPDVATVYVPVGGGALAAGVASAVRTGNPAACFTAVQAANCPALSAGLAAGKPVWVEPLPTICDGVAVPFITDPIFPLLRSLIDEVVPVTEDEVRAAQRLLFDTTRLRVEGAGALGTAAAIRRSGAAGPAVVIVSGGNVPA